MTESNRPIVHLSDSGQKRRDMIGADLRTRARHRRTGRRVLAGFGCVLFLIAGTIAIRGIGGPRASERSIVMQPPRVPEHNTLIEPAAMPPSVIVRVVTNEPLPTTRCDGDGTTSTGTVSVCILDDSQLLSMLSQTGQSYGLVKVGGKTRVVANTTPH